jgi:DNA-binding transcriptional regulator YiaG
MTSTIDETKNLRTDARVRVPAERRNELLDEFERSGISAMRFAKMAGINYATFANWRQKRRQARAQAQEVGGVNS